VRGLGRGMGYTSVALAAWRCYMTLRCRWSAIVGHVVLLSSLFYLLLYSYSDSRPARVLPSDLEVGVLWDVDTCMCHLVFSYGLCPVVFNIARVVVSSLAC
jgi:hypothetical protein